MTSLNRRDETCVFYFPVSGGTSAAQTDKREVPESRDTVAEIWKDFKP